MTNEDIINRNYGIFFNNLVKAHVINRIKSLDFKDYSHDKQRKAFNDLVSKYDMKDILFSTSLVMLVSAIEVFLKDCVMDILDTDKQRLDKLMDSKKEKKILSYDEFESLTVGELSIGKIIADKYNFQNLNSANKAYKEIFNIDLLRILGKDNSTFEEFFEKRHKIIHEGKVFPKRPNLISNYFVITDRVMQHLKDKMIKSLSN